MMTKEKRKILQALVEKHNAIDNSECCSIIYFDVDGLFYKFLDDFSVEELLEFMSDSIAASDDPFNKVDTIPVVFDSVKKEYSVDHPMFGCSSHTSLKICLYENIREARRNGYL